MHMFCWCFLLGVTEGTVSFPRLDCSEQDKGRLYALTGSALEGRFQEIARRRKDTKSMGHENKKIGPIAMSRRFWMMIHLELLNLDYR